MFLFFAVVDFYSFLSFFYQSIIVDKQNLFVLGTEYVRNVQQALNFYLFLGQDIGYIFYIEEINHGSQNVLGVFTWIGGY